MKKSGRSIICALRKRVRRLPGVSATAMLDAVFVEISVVLGKTTMPIHQLLRMGRGAVIELESGEKDEVLLLANNKPIARGEVVVRGDRVAIEITRMLTRDLALAVAA